MHAFFHPVYAALSLPAGHVFPADKYRLSYDLIHRAAGPAITWEAPTPVSEEALLRVHQSGYVEKIRRGTLTTDELRALGLPWGEGLFPRGRHVSGGTLAAARAALGEGIACNLAGGTHHAFPDRGRGFCVFNDVAIAIRQLAEDDGTRHVFIADTDAHQGDANHLIFAGDPHVFTYSIHVGANYPSHKVPGTLDVPLPRYASGAEYLTRLAETLPAALRAFEPDLVFWIAGADVHASDRFGQLRLSDEDIAARDRLVLRACREVNAPVAVLYGGGYSAEGAARTAALHAGTVLRALAAG